MGACLLSEKYHRLQGQSRNGNHHKKVASRSAHSSTKRISYPLPTPPRKEFCLQFLIRALSLNSYAIKHRNDECSHRPGSGQVQVNKALYTDSLAHYGVLEPVRFDYRHPVRSSTF